MVNLTRTTQLCKLVLKKVLNRACSYRKRGRLAVRISLLFLFSSFLVLDSYATEDQSSLSAYLHQNREDREYPQPRSTQTSLSVGIYDHIDIMDPHGFFHRNAYRGIHGGKRLVVKGGSKRFHPGLTGYGAVYVFYFDENSNEQHLIFQTEDRIGGLTITAQSRDILYLQSDARDGYPSAEFQFDLVNLEWIISLIPSDETIIANPANNYPLDTNSGSSKTWWIVATVLVCVGMAFRRTDLAR